MDGEEVGAGETGVELDEFGTELVGALLADVGVVGDDVHPERRELLCDLLADAAEADDAEDLAVDLVAEVVGLGPLAVFQAGVGLRNRARGGEAHRHRVFGGGADVPLGCVGDDDAVLSRGVDVDVVDADAGASDDDEVGCRLEHLGGHLRSGADDEPVRVGDGFEQRVTFDVVRGLYLVTGLA